MRTLEAPSITVVVIVRDQPESHKIALHSLLNIPQCSEKWEIVVCDNGSNPKMKELIDWSSYSSKIPISYLNCEPTFSLSLSRNIGISQAKSPIILCIDGDIVLPPRLVQKHLNLQREKHRIIGGCRKWFKLDDDLNIKCFQSFDPTLSYSNLIRLPNSSCSVTLKRERNEHKLQFLCCKSEPWRSTLSAHLSFPKGENMYFDENLVGWGFEDIEFSLRQMLINRYQIEFYPDLFVYHCDSDDRSFNPLRTKSNHPLIVNNLIRNMIYVAEKYPLLLKIEATMTCLDKLSYSAISDSWTIGSAYPCNRLKKYQMIKEWYTRKNS